MRIQRGNSHLAHLRGNYQPRTLDLARDVMQLPCTSSHMDGTIRQGITTSCRIRTTRAGSHDVTRALKKTNLAIRGGSPREHMRSAGP